MPLYKGLTSRIVALAVFGVLLLGLSLASITINLLYKEAAQNALKEVNVSMHVAWNILNRRGSVFSKQGDRLYIGDHLLNDDYALVDRIKEIAGGTATIFRDDKCTVEKATNGADAVELILKRRYDLVFMDCQMPILDGLEATQRIREKEKETGAHTIIVALTADAMHGDKERCLRAGMDDYLYKPFKPEQIANMLKKWQAL
jgi:CheY-like chemotaxis protein